MATSSLGIYSPTLDDIGKCFIPWGPESESLGKLINITYTFEHGTLQANDINSWQKRILITPCESNTSTSSSSSSTSTSSSNIPSGPSNIPLGPQRAILTRVPANQPYPSLNTRPRSNSQNTIEYNAEEVIEEEPKYNSDMEGGKRKSKKSKKHNKTQQKKSRKQRK